MTDNEIITIDEAITHCYEVADRKCDDCGKEHLQLAKWLEELKESREIINRQKAEIERLQDYNENLQTANTALSNEILDSKSEAIKEFAERLKTEIISDTAYGCDCNQHSGYYDYTIKIGDIPEYIDNLVKEMTEG